MPSTNKTTNHGLNQWTETDKPKREDFNADNAKLENILTPTVNQATAPTSAGQSGTIAAVIGWLANRIKAITGKANWHESPATTLEACKTHIDSTIHTAATTSKSGIMTAADKMRLDCPYYGVCSTAAATAAKTVGVASFARFTGARVTVSFSNANTAENPTLNVNSTGAAAIFYRGAAITPGFIQAGGLYDFIFNGTQWEMTDGMASSTTYGSVIMANTSYVTDRASVIPYFYLDQPTTINLNDYRLNGDWTFYSIQTTALNFPPGTWTGASNSSYLEVRRFWGQEMVRQILHKRDTNEMWLRYSTGSSAWGAWERISTDTHIHNAVTQSVNGFMLAADKIKLDCIYYGSCSTAAATVAKTVGITGFTRFTGAKAAVKFTVTNTATNPTLNINGTGAANILYMGNYITPTFLQANGVYEVVFTGSYYEVLNAAHSHDVATQSAAGFISADDKKRLDGMATGAQKNSDITKAEIEAKLTGSISTHTHANATGSAAGLVTLANNTSTTDQSSVIPYHFISSPATVDLNDYRTLGDWTFYSIGTATNFPTGTWTGSGNTPYLEVRRWYTDAAMRQILHKRGTNEIWVRYCTSATAWGAWEKLSTEAHTHAAVTQSANGFMTAADKTKLDCTYYGTCSTAGATAEKTVAITGFVRATGARVSVKFSNTNSASNPYLNVNNTGGYYIYYMGNYVPPANLKANGVYDFVFTGSYYEMTGATATTDEATQSTAGLMSASDKTKLDNAVSSNTASRLMLRDANARAQVNDPSAAYDIMNKNYADAYYVRLATACTMSAILTAQSNTSYTTKQVRNIVFWTSGTTPPTTSNGDVIIKTF